MGGGGNGSTAGFGNRPDSAACCGACHHRKCCRPSCEDGNYDSPHGLCRGRRPSQAWSVASLARPGGNLTGINFFIGEVAAKRLELLRELVPGAVRVAVLVNPANPNLETTSRDVEAAAKGMGLKIQFHNAGTIDEVDAAFTTFARERPDALFVGP